MSIVTGKEALILESVRNNLWDWQSLSPATGVEGTFFQFCDALEVKNGTVASESGWGLDHALPAWGAFWKSSYLKLRKSYTLSVFREKL